MRECSVGVLDDLLGSDDCEGFGLIAASPPALEFSFTLFSLMGAGFELPKSSAVPGVLGVFPEDPNDAKAPEPNPKAEDAPLVGEATLVVVKGAMPLKGFDLLLKEPSPPNRFAGW